MVKEYANFKELEKNEFGNYFIKCIDRGSKVTILAPHGGRIEPGTDTIAKAIACQNFNYYGFIAERSKIEGRKNMHITSHKFDESKALELVGKSKVVIAIHGCKDEQIVKDIKKNFGKHIFIGGRDEVLKDKLEKVLWEAGLAIGREKFKGIEKDNICNRGTTGKGIQFELTKSFRNDAMCRDKFIETVRRFLLTQTI